MLEEVVAYWRRYDSIFPELENWIDESISMLSLPEDERMDYFQVLGLNLCSFMCKFGLRFVLQISC